MVLLINNYKYFSNLPFRLSESLNLSKLLINRNSYDGWNFPPNGLPTSIPHLKQSYTVFNKKFFDSKLPDNVKILSITKEKEPHALGFIEYDQGLNNENDCFDNYKDLDFLPERVWI